jgi:quercetin dioxygenase-like cupin family protein
MVYELSDIAERELIPGFDVRFVHTERMTFAYWTVREGAELPHHSHPHEQVCQLQEGRFELTIADQTQTLEPGQVAVIPGDAPHSGKALTACRIMDTFAPPRDDYR